jgi:hypothetical protein
MREAEAFIKRNTPVPERSWQSCTIGRRPDLERRAKARLSD